MILPRGSMGLGTERNKRLYCYVVEGKTDEDKLKKLGLKLIIKTYGKFIKADTLAFIKAVSHYRPIVFVTDPDPAGKEIRISIEKELAEKDYHYVETGMKEAYDGKKFGIAQMKMPNLEKTMDVFIKHDKEVDEKPTINLADLMSLGIAGFATMAKRQVLLDKLGFQFKGTKALLDGLWMLGLDKEKLARLLA